MLSSNAGSPHKVSIRSTTANCWRDSVGQGAVMLLIVIFAMDAVSRAVASSTAEIGVFDEPAHLATAGLLLLALVALSRRGVPAPFLAAALVASVALDLDHVPQYLGWNELTEVTPRPYTHSLVTPIVLLLVAVATDRFARQVALGAAFGVGAHLFRDLATASGVALVWPASNLGVRIPYLLYAAGMLSVAGAVAMLSRPHAYHRSPVTEPSRDLG
jgi:inner membrane protein